MRSMVADPTTAPIGLVAYIQRRVPLVTGGIRRRSSTDFSPDNIDSAKFGRIDIIASSKFFTNPPLSENNGNFLTRYRGGGHEVCTANRI